MEVTPVGDEFSSIYFKILYFFALNTEKGCRSPGTQEITECVEQMIVSDPIY